MKTLSTGNAVRKREFDGRFGKLHAVGASQILGSNCAGTNDLDGTRAGTVSTSHLVVKLGNSSNESDISEFTVHIVRSRSGRVAEPDSVILHNSGVLFNNLDTVKNFTGGGLHLTELMHVIPELGFGNHFVGGENNHTVCFRVWGIVSGSLTANHLILTHKSCNSHLLSLKGKECERYFLYDIYGLVF